MKYNIKKEFDDELKYFKGLMNQSYHTFLVPMITEVAALVQSVLKAEKTLLFLQNKEIDMLYSLSLSTETTQNAGQFTMNSIRMKNNLGLAGKAFTSGKIINQTDTKGDKTQQYLIAEEKDLGKLGVSEVKNAVAIPVLDKQNGMPQAVLVVYNYDREVFEQQNMHVDTGKS